jgi:hypothetical protein
MSHLTATVSNNVLNNQGICATCACHTHQVIPPPSDLNNMLSTHVVDTLSASNEATLPFASLL